MSWMICGQSRRFWLRICASSGVRSRSLLHHTLQGHAVLGSDAAAVFIFWRIVRYRAVHAGDFDSHLPPGGADTFPAAGERLARSSVFRRIVRSVAGRFFFIYTATSNASKAPSESARSITYPKICEFKSSRLASSTVIVSDVQRAPRKLDAASPTVKRSTLGCPGKSRVPAP